MILLIANYTTKKYLHENEKKNIAYNFLLDHLLMWVIENWKDKEVKSFFLNNKKHRFDNKYL